MSTEKTEAEILKHKDKSIEILNHFLSALVKRDKKKADLLSYWLHTYVNYLKFEEVFQPSRNKKYERGDIVRVNLGFNIGSEHGGLHYAMVLDNNNEKNSPVITIIPLSSSDGTNVHRTEVYLGDDIYLKLNNKISGMLLAYKTELKEIETIHDMVSSTLSTLEKNMDSFSTDEFLKQSNMAASSLEVLEAKQKSINQKKADLQVALKEVSKMKRGSIALVGQITTISKIRIEDPRNTHGVLNGIKLSPTNLDNINKKIKSLFLYE